MSYQNWQSLMLAFGFSENISTYDELMAAYSERQRHYHTYAHISACLRHLDTVRSEVDDWKTIAMAIWFHDAIYKPFSGTNERDSADWAIKFLRNNNSTTKDIQKIEAYIMATCHNAECLDIDTQTLVDIDLSVLGAAPEIYDAYEQNIRKEYRRVPMFIYRKKRKELLLMFLGRPKIFGTEYFNDLWESQARENIARAIANL